jgi:beta-glucosidase
MAFCSKMLAREFRYFYRFARKVQGYRSMSEKIDELLEQMTLQEKVALLAGASMWHTVAIERLGIPSLKVTDGPNGARGEGNFTGGMKAACFPAEISLASTWNTALVERVGQALGREAKMKGAQVLLAPTVNIHRSPLNGRNFESFSEDPYLSARLAVAYITGVQSQGIGTAVKHYVCNDSEFQRNSISSEVGERALREIYLPAFQAAVQEANAWTVMASYNKVNGTFASENAYTITQILRKEWGFAGVVMSDWFGTQSTSPSVNAGLDLEMPGPSIWRGAKLLQAVANDEVAETTIDASVRRLLSLFTKAGLFAPEQKFPIPEQAINLPEHQLLARQAAAEGIVLLKNAGNILPLRPEKIASLAIIGPNAQTARIMAGGSAQVNAHYAISPFDGIVARAGASLKIGYELGCTNYRMVPLPAIDLFSTSKDEGQHALTLEYFNNSDLTGAPVLTTITTTTDLLWFGQYPEGVNGRQFSARLSGCFTPRETGAYTFGLSSGGLSRLFIDGREVVDNWTQQTPGHTYFGTGSSEVTQVVDLVAGHNYALSIEYSKGEKVGLAGMRLGCLAPVHPDALKRAVELAASSDVALVFVGLSGEWESESFDRPDMELVGEQVALIEKVAAANKNTVVVLNTGAPITMNWLGDVAAVVQAWYPGQECGNALADVLFGDTNPSGKLPQTYPVRLEDNPAYINYPGENGRVSYGEGLFVGYRYYEKKKVAPLFPFGFGLSYTTFQYDALRLSAQEIGAQDTLEVQIDVINTGQLAGKETVQLYIHDVASSLHRPEKELKAFAKVSLEPGERTTVTLSIKREALAYYDDLACEWVAEAGEFKVLVGASSQDMRAQATFTLTETSRFGGHPQKKHVSFGMQSTVGELLENAAARAVIDTYMPGVSGMQEVTMAMNWTLEQIAGMVPDMLPEELMQRIIGDLERLQP